MVIARIASGNYDSTNTANCFVVDIESTQYRVFVVIY